MDVKHIESLFAGKIRRQIEEVIKVDQTNEALVCDEIEEYVVTDSIKRHFVDILDTYKLTPNKPHEGIAVWVSGFFGSGKSSFAKMLGLAIENRPLGEQRAARRFAERAGDPRISSLLSGINDQIPTHAVIFDVSTDRGIKSGNQMLTEIMYRLFLQSLGYAKDLDLAELEITLEAAGGLSSFTEAYRKIYKKDWDAEKGKVAFALSEASRVMHTLDPATFPQADSWVRAGKDRSDISAGKLAERCSELMNRRRPGHSLMFVVDEVGQFVARDVQKMLDLQAVVQSLGRVGRGKHWVVITSQEKLNELVSGLDNTKIELARLMDRFPLQVHLETSDISEVTSRRVLNKNAAAQKSLRTLFEANRGRLTQHTHLTADFRLPELTPDSFIDLYPLLPYQIDLIIQVVSGLRTQGGASKHVGGANRTIIKLAQQLLINPGVNLAEKRVGHLVRVDQVYDLVEGNIASEVRAKIADLAKQVPHPMAQKVAKAICLLQYVKSIHRTAENIAAALHPAADADSCLPTVKEALQELLAAHQVRLGADGYRIPTPAEDDWAQQRSKVTPRGGDGPRIHAEIIGSFFQPPPSHTFLDTRTFKAGLAFNGRVVVEGDMMVQLALADAGQPFRDLVADLRARSQADTKTLFWAVSLDDAIDRETVEVFRSKQMLERKEREARTGEETGLIAEEKRTLGHRMDELRRLLKQACLAGTIYFRGNDRSPSDRTTEVSRAVSELLALALPEVFNRFHEAAARVQKKDLDALLTMENLHGLTPVFTSLNLLRAERGKPILCTDSGPLAEVLLRIEHRTSYGETASGRYLTEEFAQEPFGWDFEIVRLFVLCLLRAGKIEATTKGQTLENTLSPEARETFGNNNLFRQATFRPKVGIDFQQLVVAGDAFQSVFGKEAKELEQGKIVAALREELARSEDSVQASYAKLLAARLPGTAILESALDQMRGLRRGSESNTILAFNTSHKSIKEAIRRAADLDTALTEPRLHDLARAQAALAHDWPFLAEEADLDDQLRSRATALADLILRETFFRELPQIDQNTRAIEKEYERRYMEALQERSRAYQSAFDQLVATPGWSDLDEAQQRRIAAPLQALISTTATPRLPIPQLRSDRAARKGRLQEAIAEMMRVLDGERLVTVQLGGYFAGGIETEEQLDSALDGLREECARLIRAGKKVLVQ